jgi:uncharacterized protein YcfL
MMRVLTSISILAALLLAGCKSEWTVDRERTVAALSVVPMNYKTEIIAYMRTYLNDPSGVREAFVSEPMQKTVGGMERYVVCVRYNAKKSGGVYAGRKDSLALFRQGRFDSLIDNAREQCKDVAFQPFPELERLSR